MKLEGRHYRIFGAWDAIVMTEARKVRDEDDMENCEVAEFLVDEYMSTDNHLLEWAQNDQAKELINAAAEQEREHAQPCWYPDMADILHCIQRAMKLHIETTL